MKVLGANNLPNLLRHATDSNQFANSEQQMGERNEYANPNYNQSSDTNRCANNQFEKNTSRLKVCLPTTMMLMFLRATVSFPIQYFGKTQIKEILKVSKKETIISQRISNHLLVLVPL